MPRLNKPQLPPPQPVQQGTQWNSIWVGFNQVSTYLRSLVQNLQSYLNSVYNAVVPLQFPPIAVSGGAYTVHATDVYLGLAASASPVTLPSATGSGRVLVLQKTDSSAQTIIIAPSGSDTIGGATEAVLGIPRAGIIIEDAAAGQWQIIGQFPAIQYVGLVALSSPFVLQPAEGTQAVLAFQKTDATNTPITIQANGADTINGQPTHVLISQYEVVVIQDARQGQWETIAKATPALRYGPKIVAYNAAGYAVLSTDSYLGVAGGASATAMQVFLPPATGFGRVLLIQDLGTYIGGPGITIGVIPSGADVINQSFNSGTPLVLTTLFRTVMLIDAAPGQWYASFWSAS